MLLLHLTNGSQISHLVFLSAITFSGCLLTYCMYVIRCINIGHVIMPRCSGHVFELCSTHWEIHMYTYRQRKWSVVTTVCWIYLYHMEMVGVGIEMLGKWDWEWGTGLDGGMGLGTMLQKLERMGTISHSCVAQLAERRSLAGELTLFYARPAANG